PILKLRVAGGLYGRKSGSGWYAYEDGKRVEPARPEPPGARPQSVWVSPRDPSASAKATALLQRLGAQIETGDSPSAGALCIVTPTSGDCTSEIVEQKLDRQRTVALDTFFNIDKHRTLMVP